MFADLISTGKFITTKLQSSLKDCKNRLVAVSKEGKSKEKDFELSYNQAFRDAFTTLRELNYKYQSSTPAQPLAVQPIDSTQTQQLLYAQPIATGFQLVDSSPKVVYKLVSTSSPLCFIAYKGDLQGVLLLKNDEWFFEYYASGQLNSQRVGVNF